MHRKQNSGINHLQAVQSVTLNLGFGIGLEFWYLWFCKKSFGLDQDSRFCY